MNPRKGFTLVEILIVVLILGILAAIVLPRFSSASSTARASMMADDLRVMRVQLEVYKAQHRGIAAGYPAGGGGASDAAFIAQMTLATDEESQTAPVGTDGYRYGPYLREIPVNPINGKNTIRVVADGEACPAQATDTHGWVYQPSEMMVKADSNGQDDAGRAYWDY